MDLSPAKDPATLLGRYRRLSPNAGIYVSPFQIGASALGNKWPQMGNTDKESAFKYLDAFFEAGGNFIDTANNYHGGENEQWIGEWIEARGNRDQIVLATKYTGAWTSGDPKTQNNAAMLGNSSKSMALSVDASLKKLQTRYIDILYLHWWDWTCSMEEVMNGLHALILRGKVLYLGASNTPAWVVAKANQYSRDHGRPQFVIYQGEWNVLCRDVERDILPLCRADGMAFAPWNMLRTGRLRTDDEENERILQGNPGRIGYSDSDWKRNDLEKKMAGILGKIALECGTKDIRSVLIAYHLQKMPYVFPLVGGHKIEQLISNIDALRLVLTEAHIKEIEDAVPFDLGYPHKYIHDGSTANSFNCSEIAIDVESLPAAIRPTILAKI